MSDHRLVSQNQQRIEATTSAEIPPVGFGTYQTGGYKCYNAVAKALEAGYRHIDTAMAYDNEAAVGRAIDQSSVSREDVFLTTKIKGYTELLEHDRLLEAADGCLERLDTDYIDLLLIHWWNPDVDMEETFAAMDELVDAGKVDHIGVSNFSVDQLKQAMEFTDAPIFTNQIEYHPYWSQPELLSFCQENDIVLTAYSPLAEGRTVDDGTLGEIGSRYGKTPAQVSIRWLIQQENVVTIPKSVTPEYIRENIRVFDFELTDAEMRRITELEGPFWYRQNRQGGEIHKVRGLVGPVVDRVTPDRLVSFA
ncbi:aldo/keto reductase [Halovenus sp. WSH3]|uniref:Aldo/keto reductase n=1 Tax=Halovenus carboxidivorans TaxID=2692199 RepID=A0A6B0T6K7_9EURY|nr:aldo/keto reductase [Halovenus carboxidivorans]MXR50912.1 aldo/keto reductase [Halovenus carboxidivorans]